MPPSSIKRDFVIVEPNRTSCDYFSRALNRAGRLRLHCIGTRRGVSGVDAELTRLKPAFGLVTYAASKFVSNFRAESFRFRLHPWIDRWALKMLQSGDNVISSYGYANDCFKFARANRGKTFLDAGNSHPENFWAIMSEELKRWKSPFTPVARHHYERSLAMLEHTDYILAPSSFVANSFVALGFPKERVLLNHFPVNLTCFSPLSHPRPKGRPLTIISTGRLSLRKGTPYMLEAFDAVHKKHPSAKFLLTHELETNILPVLEKYSHLPIEWSPSLPHVQLAERLRRADIFVLPSLEDGFAVTVAEALGCGLPVITTPNTGAADLITPGENGEIVPIRDSKGIADALLKWADKVVGTNEWPGLKFDSLRLSNARFESTFLAWLDAIGIPPRPV